ncbi:MAG: acyltransferase [Bdellovibrionaceae bacterium]|nr:acyltransferase [Pseudobdellovibrionaceae bacterium]
MPSSSGPRFPALDGLRALAILLVVGHHLAHYVSLDGKAAWFRAIVGTGWNGVYLFFVLSGFLVGGLALRELNETGGLHLRRFWVRRLLRTWPLYFLLLFLNAIRHSGPIEPSLWHYLTFTQNLFSPKFFLVTWSLAVEEQFYFFLPLSLALLWKWKHGRIAGGLLFAALVIATYLYRWIEGNGFYKFFHTFAVVDSLLLGYGLAYLHSREKLGWLLRHPNLYGAVGLVFVYGAHFTHWNRFWQTNFLFGGQAIGFALLVGAALSPRFLFRSWLSHRFLAWVASLSFSIYLSHDKPLYYAARIAQYLGLEDWGLIVFLIPTVMAGSLLLAWVLYHAVEKPALKWRDRVCPKEIVSVSEKKRLQRLRTSAAKS